MKQINGSHEEGYRQLPEYCRDLEKNNPGSVIDLCTTNDGRFQRVFICLAAASTGFVYCRPLLGLDSSHIKTAYHGVLLTATSVDALGQLFPVAYAIVDAETKENWYWFVENLRKSLSPRIPSIFNTPNALTILSDRQKGLLEAVIRELPNAAHGYCLRHLEANFLKHFKHPELRPLLWKAA